MQGLIFEYYKYVRYAKDSLSDIKEIFAYEDAKISFLTYGVFERLKVISITDIGRYRDLSLLARKWIGNRQSLLFYTIDDDPLYIYKEEPSESDPNKIERFGFYNTKSKAYDTHLFLAVTEFPFMSIHRKDEDCNEWMLKIRDEMRVLINKRIEEKHFNMSYMFLGNIDIYGISVLWFADQYIDVLDLVNYLRNKTNDIFQSAYTNISKNNLNGDITEEVKEAIKNIQGNAIIQFTVKKHLGENLEYHNSDIVKNVQHSAGQYDVVLEMTAKDVYCKVEINDPQEENYGKYSILNHDSDAYQREILQTRVTLTQEMIETDDEIIEEKAEKDKDNICSNDALLKSLKNIKQESEKARKLLKKTFVHEAGIVDTFDALVCDYRYNAVSAVNEKWADDFSHIFLRHIMCIENICGFYNTARKNGRHISDGNIMEIMRILMNNLKQQIFHISESNSLNFEMPKCHLRYTGNEDCIMFGYMGIIKEILETVYKLDGINMQSEIVPIVTVDAVPIIESDLYFDKPYTVDNQDDSSNDAQFKIMAINLPHVSFYDVPKYMPYLYHEIYHYVVPSNRIHRDYYMGLDMANNFYYHMIKGILCDILSEKKKDKAVSEALCSRIAIVIMKAVARQYDDIFNQFKSKYFAKDKKDNRDNVVWMAENFYRCLYKLFADDIERWTIGNVCSIFGNILGYIDEELKCDEADEITYRSLNNDETLKNNQEELKILIEALQSKLMSSDGKLVNSGTIILLCEEDAKIMKANYDSLKEVKADIPMIELSDMPIEEYLLYYIMCLRNLMITSQAFEVTNEHKEFKRLKLVYEYYKRFNVVFNEELREKLEDLYIVETVIVHYDKTDGVDKLLSDMATARKEVNVWWKKLVDDVNCASINWLNCAPSVMDKLIDMSTISNRGVNVKENSKTYFTRYRENRRKYAEELKKLVSKIEREDDISVRRNILKDFKNTTDKYQSEVMKINISFYNKFQGNKKLVELLAVNDRQNEIKKSKDFKEIKKIDGSSFKVKINYNKMYPSVLWVNDYNRFMYALKTVTKIMDDDCCRILGQVYPLWYRGQNNALYGLLPSLMRSNEIRRKNFAYLSQFQRHLFEEFKYRADGAPEIIDKSQYTTSDYLALMQHYSVHTSLMDWSEDAFTSIYFALENLINGENEKESKDAAIYIFSPYLYNRARRQMISKGDAGLMEDNLALRASLKTVNGVEGEIPNISTKYNEEIYEMFLLGNSKYEGETKYGCKDEIKLSGKKEMAFLPVAVHTSQLNPRIRTQSGIFLAYNLYAMPDNNGEYSYMELEKIQEFYLGDEFKCEDKTPFLYKIIIRSVATRNVADCFRALGLSKARVYPELENISRKIK